MGIIFYLLLFESDLLCFDPEHVLAQDPQELACRMYLFCFDNETSNSAISQKPRRPAAEITTPCNRRRRCGPGTSGAPRAQLLTGPPRSLSD